MSADGQELVDWLTKAAPLGPCAFPLYELSGPDQAVCLAGATFEIHADAGGGKQVTYLSCKGHKDIWDRTWNRLEHPNSTSRRRGKP